MAEVLAAAIEPLERLLARRGMSIDGGSDTAADEGHSVRERLGAASMQQVTLTGPRAHHPTARLRTPFASPSRNATVLGRRRARIDGMVARIAVDEDVVLAAGDLWADVTAP